MSKPKNLMLAVSILILAAAVRLGQITNVPPGMDNDEAFHLLRAQEILRGETWPVYITGNNGNEPLFAYLGALGLALVGPTAWTGRLMAAWVGLLGVAVTVRLGREMFPRRPIGLLAGLVLATLLWHVDFSRFGSQPILAATAGAGAMAALWRGAHTGSRRHYILAGVCLSLGLEAYVAFRLFPLAVLAAGLALLMTRPAQRWCVLQGGLWAVGAALLVYAPLGLFFIQNPDWFFNRFGQATQGMLNMPNLLTNALKTLGGLFWEGDANWRHNLAGRPALDAAQALFFATGVVSLLWRWRKPESWTLLAWLVVGLAPSVLTIEAPHFGRTTMVIPALGILIALGIETAWQVARSRLARGFIAGCVVLSGVVPIWLYFGVWAGDARVFQAFDIQQFEIARQLKAAPTGAALYATPLQVGWLHDYWTLEYLLGREAWERYTAFNGARCTIAPTRLPYGARYVVVATEADDLRTPAILSGLYANVQHTVVPVPGERRPVLVYDVPPGSQAQITDEAPQTEFGTLARLINYQYSPQTLVPGEQLRLEVIWETLKPSAEPYKVFVHLLGSPKTNDSILYAQYDGEPCAYLYPTAVWHPGELLFEIYTLNLPTDLPPGNYELEIGWYVEATGARLPIADADTTAFRLAKFTMRQR